MPVQICCWYYGYLYPIHPSTTSLTIISSLWNKTVQQPSGVAAELKTNIIGTTFRVKPFNWYRKTQGQIESCWKPKDETMQTLHKSSFFHTSGNAEYTMNSQDALMTMLTLKEYKSIMEAMGSLFICYFSPPTKASIILLQSPDVSPCEHEQKQILIKKLHSTLSILYNFKIRCDVTSCELSTSTNLPYKCACMFCRDSIYYIYTHVLWFLA